MNESLGHRPETLRTASPWDFITELVDSVAQPHSRSKPGFLEARMAQQICSGNGIMIRCWQGGEAFTVTQEGQVGTSCLDAYGVPAWWAERQSQELWE